MPRATSKFIMPNEQTGGITLLLNFTLLKKKPIKTLTLMLLCVPYFLLVYVQKSIKSRRDTLKSYLAKRRKYQRFNRTENKKI